MKIINSKLAPSITASYQTKCGIVYFFENFIVSEVNEGVIYNWKCSQEIIELALMHYGPNSSINLISNRVNNYSVNPTYWVDYYKYISPKFIHSISFIVYNELSILNAKLEQNFIKCKTRSFTNLFHAVSWLRELPNNEESVIKVNESLNSNPIFL